MSVERQLFDAITPICPRMFFDFADIGTLRPYVTCQHVGGQSLRFIDNTAANIRHTEFQVNVWADSRFSAITLARQIEDALCVSTAFQATPNGEPVSDFDADMKVYGCRQDFNIFAPR